MAQDDRTVRITLQGDLGIHHPISLENMLPDPRSANRVLLDCAQVSAVDSTFITALMRYRHAFAAAGNDPHDIVVIVQPSVRRIFEIAGLHRVLTIITAPEATTPTTI